MPWGRKNNDDSTSDGNGSEEPTSVYTECGCGNWSGTFSDWAAASAAKNEHIRTEHTGPRHPLQGNPGTSL
jgi:hypothetical protein